MKDVLHCGHSTLLAHAQAVDIYRKYFQSIQGGKISIVLNAEWAEPLNKNSAVDKFFAQFKMDYMLGWFADPVYLTGQYPMKMRIGLLRHLPWFTADQSKLIKGSADFLGLNHYTSTFVTHPLASAKDSQGGGKLPWLATYHDNDGKLIGKHAQSSWLYDVPWGLTSLLEYIKNRYNDPDIYITENGFSVKGEANMTLSASLQDDARVRYFNGYLDAMKVAIRKGCKVKGYIAWTLMDNFEWAAGYSERFGVVAVSPDATVRVPKASFYFLKNYFATSMS